VEKEEMTYHRSARSGPFTTVCAAWRVAVAGILPVVIGIGAEPARAQAQASRGGYTGFFAAGISGVSTAELDDRLSARGYPAFGARPRGVALGAYRLLRSGVMLGGEWHVLSLGEEQHGGRDVWLGGGYATLGVGYAFELSRRVRVYPRLGVGVGGMGLWIENENTGAGGGVEFDEALAAPRADPEHSTLSQGSMAVDLRAGAEVLLRRRGGGPLVGLRVGYVATPFDQGWTRDGHSLSGAPEATVAGPYVRLALGWRRER